MTVPDEELFAFVDGELPPEAMARIEAAMATDPQLALRVETQRSLRRLLSGSHGGSARQPEARGAGAAQSPPEAKEAEVIAFPGAQAKKDKARKDKAKTKETVRPRDARASRPGDGSGRGLPVGIGLAACLLVGLAMGWLAAPAPTTLSGADDAPPIAAGPLAKALNGEASGVAEGPVRIALTFKTPSGVYCRAFQAAGRTPVAGVACREDTWRVRAVVPDKVGSPLPAAVLTAVDAMSAGPPLDAAAEAKARTDGWKPAR